MWTDVAVAVQDPIVNAKRSWNRKQTGARLAEGDDREFDDDGVERVNRLGPMHVVPEPEPPFADVPAGVARAGVARIHLLPALTARRDDIVSPFEAHRHPGIRPLLRTQRKAHPPVLARGLR